MFYLFLADGFEDVEALAPLDVMRRAGIHVEVLGIGNNVIKSSHNVNFVCDRSCAGLVFDESLDGVILPGGMPGTKNLENNIAVKGAVDYCYKNDKLICAICAAPSILGHMGILKGRKAVCYPGFEDELNGAEISGEPVVRDGNIITAKGMGVAVDFGLEIISAFLGEDTAKRIAKQIQKQ